MTKRKQSKDYQLRLWLVKHATNDDYQAIYNEICHWSDQDIKLYQFLYRCNHRKTIAKIEFLKEAK